jgi:hypothetical protein
MTTIGALDGFKNEWMNRGIVSLAKRRSGDGGTEDEELMLRVCRLTTWM